MINLSYLLALIVVICCLLLIDWRYKLVLFYDAKHALPILLLGVVFFLLWDIAGVFLGIFFIGSAPYLTGIHIMKNVPLEELFFLVVLVYNPLLAYEYIKRKSV